jgi:hypothetical protein
MTERSGAEIWTRVERRLAAVEAFIPDAPAWDPSPAAELHTIVHLGTTTRRTAGERRRSPLVLVFAALLLLLTLVAGALLVGAFLADRTDERFGPWGALRQQDSAAHAVLLPDGRALIVSGEWQGMGNPRARADLWGSRTGVDTIEPSTIRRVNPTTTLLLDGRVLVIGGFGGGTFAYASSAIASAEIWEPATTRFRESGAMAAARVGHTATLLPDGRVLVVGGAGPYGAVVEAELWDPRTETFSPAGRSAKARTGHAATLLLDGRVMVASGVDPIAGAGVPEVEIWDPSSMSFTTVMSLIDRPTSVGLTRLPSGSVLVSGAFVPPSRPPGYRGALVWDPDDGTQLRLESATARERHSTLLLPDGRVMVAGGIGLGGGRLDSVEMWHPADGLFHEVAPLRRPVGNHTAIRLADGAVLIVPDAFGPDGVIEPFIYRPEAMP